MSDLHAQRGVVTETEVVLIAAGDVVARAVDGEAETTREAHLADFLDEKAVARQRLANGGEIVDLRLNPRDRRASPRLQTQELVAPRGRRSMGAERVDEGSDALRRVGDDSDVRLETHHFDRIDVDANDLGAGGSPLPAHILQLQSAADPD